MFSKTNLKTFGIAVLAVWVLTKTGPGRKALSATPEIG